MSASGWQAAQRESDLCVCVCEGCTLLAITVLLKGSAFFIATQIWCRALSSCHDDLFLFMSVLTLCQCEPLGVQHRVLKALLMDSIS